ncbi:MAG TPA: AraC family transcriptional regulator [Armatimonadota bacterium]
MSDLAVILHGINTPHERGYLVNRPAREGSWFVFCFQTPFVILTAQGIEQGAPGDCIIHDPTFPEYHGSVPGAAEGFRNDWLHVTGAGMARLVAQYRLPVNQRIATGQPHLLTPWISEMAREQFTRDPYWEEAVAQTMAGICLRLARHRELQLQYGQYSRQALEQHARVRLARERVLQEFAHPWTIAEMAELVGVSPSHFSLLYQRLYHSSPLEEVIATRIAEACKQLLSTADTLETIASRCGFSSPHYFSRQFQQRLGCAPGRYRHAKGDDAAR